MLKKAKTIFSAMWDRNKTLSIFLIVTCVLHIILLTMVLRDFVQLREVSGTIDNVYLDKYKKELYLKLRLNSDQNNYYQVYYKRLSDKNISDLKKSASVEFYTTKKTYKKSKAILSNDPSSAFEYYPIFNINGQKKITSVLLFHFYRNSLFTILLYISLAGSFFYVIPFVAVTNWRYRLVVLSMVAIYVYLFY